MEKDKKNNAYQELKIRLFMTWKMWQLFHEASQSKPEKSASIKLAPVINRDKSPSRQKPFTQTHIGRIARRSMRRQHSDGR